MKLLALFVVLSGLVFAADPPSGASLIQLCMEREGGAAAMSRIHSAVTTGTVELVGHNLSGPLEIDQQGDRQYTVIQLPGIGKIEEGFDGQVAWESNILQGSRIKEGEELELAKRAARISPLSDWQEDYQSAVTVGSEDVNGKPAWKVAMTPKHGNVEYYFFDRDSGLMVKMTQTMATAMGDVPMEATMDDYRLVNGIQTPFLMRQTAMGQNMAMHIDKVTYNAEIPAGRFELPPAIKALTEKKKP